jgi:hypothetical protein
VEILHYNEKSARLEESLLSWEDTFSFDVLGWVVLPGGLDVEQIAELQGADGAAGAALVGQALHGYVEELCGIGYRNNGPARRAGEHGADGREPLTGGNGVRALGRAYINMTGWNQVRSDAGEAVPALTRSGGRWEPVRIRQCCGLVVGVALRDIAPEDLSLCFVSSSHKSEMPEPTSILTQTVPGGHLERPSLSAGDVVIASSATLHGLRSATGAHGVAGAVLVAEYISASAPLSSPSEDSPSLPEWANALSDIEQVLLGAGARGGPQQPIVLSDGKHVWTEDAATALGSAQAHPSIMMNASSLETSAAAKPGHCQPDPLEVWAFDTHGFLLVKNVMDADWIEEAIAAIDACVDHTVTRGIGGGQ